MAVNSSEECQNHYVLGLLDGGTTDPQLNVGAHVENLNTLKSSKSELSNDAKLKMDNASVLNVDVENGKHDSKSNEEYVGNLKTDDSLIRALQREISLQLGGKFMQLFMKHGTDLPKFASRDKYLIERVYDMPTNRMRKYKRSTSFNSRRVVLLFSVLSSLGTIILIYLTLRVRQIGDGSGNL